MFGKKNLRRKNGRFISESKARKRQIHTIVQGIDHSYFEKAKSDENVALVDDLQECVEVGLDAPSHSQDGLDFGRADPLSSQSRWQEGRALVDLGVLFNSFACQKCGQPLDASKCVSFVPDSLSGYVYIPCSNPLCHYVNQIPLGKEQKRKTRHSDFTMFDINKKAVAGCLKAGIKLKQLNDLMTELGACEMSNDTWSAIQSELLPTQDAIGDERFERLIKQMKAAAGHSENDRETHQDIAPGSFGHVPNCKGHNRNATIDEKEPHVPIANQGEVLKVTCKLEMPGPVCISMLLNGSHVKGSPYQCWVLKGYQENQEDHDNSGHMKEAVSGIGDEMNQQRDQQNLDFSEYSGEDAGRRKKDVRRIFSSGRSAKVIAGKRDRHGDEDPYLDDYSGEDFGHRRKGVSKIFCSGEAAKIIAGKTAQQGNSYLDDYSNLQHLNLGIPSIFTEVCDLKEDVENDYENLQDHDESACVPNILASEYQALAAPSYAHGIGKDISSESVEKNDTSSDNDEDIDIDWRLHPDNPLILSLKNYWLVRGQICVRRSMCVKMD